METNNLKIIKLSVCIDRCAPFSPLVVCGFSDGSKQPLPEARNRLRLLLFGTVTTRCLHCKY